MAVAMGMGKGMALQVRRGMGSGGAWCSSLRCMSSPGAGGTKRMSVLELQHKRRTGEKITMVTAYSYPQARHVDLAGIDIVLVGDSVAMVEMGHQTTQPVNMEQMLHHCQSVARGAKRALLVGDMPFGSYEVGDDAALVNAYRFLKEAGMDAVKLEGGKLRAKTVEKLVSSGVAVMGHVGLTPQAISVLGGFRAQGRTAKKARELVDDALALQGAGAFALVIECVPPIVARAITDAVQIPTIGIGAGVHTTGQVLVYHDMLGYGSHPHHEKYVPKFCKTYAQIGHTIHEALIQFRADVANEVFPSDQYSPYKMSKEEEKQFVQLLKADEDERNAKGELLSKQLHDKDEYAVTKIY